MKSEREIREAIRTLFRIDAQAGVSDTDDHSQHEKVFVATGALSWVLGESTALDDLFREYGDEGIRNRDLRPVAHCAPPRRLLRQPALQQQDRADMTRVCTFQYRNCNAADSHRPPGQRAFFRELAARWRLRCHDGP